MPLPNHVAIIAAAGSGKTQRIVTDALDAVADGKRVLVTTYTVENRNQIERRICELAGVVPPQLEIMTWFSFIINELCRPYQLGFIGDIGVVRSLDFHGKPNRFMKKTSTAYYLNGSGDVYKDRASALALACNDASGGLVLRRLEAIYSMIFIDEMQDLSGHDFDLLDALLTSNVRLYLVGDPRQSLYFTDQSNKNAKYKGPRFVSWLDERATLCDVETLTTSYRCSQPILDWADNLFPEYPRTTSLQADADPSHGVSLLKREDVAAYIADHGTEVTILRRQKNTDTMGLPAINIGVAKGSTYSHVVLFGSGPMMKYALGQLALADFKERSRLYVAVTRARYTVAIVV